uniref:7TM GPCR serpentine receptor class x (Srx) domain-containing protein n=1 Tax=Angiostrongylus cantonensis TaxID=6313 RepID=A0A0K0D9A8_ANGCA
MVHLTLAYSVHITGIFFNITYLALSRIKIAVYSLG